MTPATGPIAFEPFFLDGAKGRLFCIYRGPGDGRRPRGGVLFVPPFAEELNKVRRQVALQANALAERGFAVLTLDLFGTGDSAGDLSEARLDIWRDDLRRGIAYLQSRGAEELVLWGVRLGALLAVDLLDTAGADVNRMLLWQPVPNGKQHVSQFLRLRVAASMISGDNKESTTAIMSELEGGRSVEVAGYSLHPELVDDLSKLTLGNVSVAALPPLGWFETVPTSERPMSAVSRRTIDQWQEQGAQVSAQVAVGEPFWATPEIALVPELIDQTCAACEAAFS